MINCGNYVNSVQEPIFTNLKKEVSQEMLQRSSSCMHLSGNTWAFEDKFIENCDLESIEEVEYRFDVLKCYLSSQTPLQCGEDCSKPNSVPTYKYRVTHAQYATTNNYVDYYFCNDSQFESQLNIDMKGTNYSTGGLWHMGFYCGLLPVNYSGPCYVWNNYPSCESNSITMNYMQVNFADMAEHIIDESAYNLNRTNWRFYGVAITTHDLNTAASHHNVLIIYKSCNGQSPPNNP